MESRCEKCVTLRECQLGTFGVVSCVMGTAANAGTVRRLAELGVRRGATLSAVQRTPGGGRIVAIGDGRLALDKATLAALHICPVPQTLAAEPAPAA